MPRAASLSTRLFGCALIALASLCTVLPKICFGEARSADGARTGALIDIGTHRLHLNCVGQGEPTVVFEAGLGGLAVEWMGVQQRLASRQRACAYDRSGYGLSEPSPAATRTSAQHVEELLLLLQHARIAGPYILVGHSYGGYTVQLFAKRYPQLTAGLVLVDSSHPQQVERFLAPPLNMNTVLARDSAGVVMLRGPVELPAHMPEAARAVALRLMSLPSMRRAVTEEFLYFRDSAAEVIAAGELPAVPLIVLSRGRPERNTEEEEGRLAEALWGQLQAELAEMSPRAAHLIAEGSGQHVHLDQPELIADAVRLVIEASRSEDKPVRMGTSFEPARVTAQAAVFKNATVRKVAPELMTPLERIAATGSSRNDVLASLAPAKHGTASTREFIAASATHESARLNAFATAGGDRP